MKYKNHNIPDNKIEAIVDKLGVSIVEACEMYLSDNGLVKDETVEKLTKKAQKNKITNTIHSAKSSTGNRKPRTKKENPLKQEIIDAIFTGLLDYHPDKKAFNIRNNEKYIDFTIANRDFTVNLVEHRKKKWKRGSACEGFSLTAAAGG